LSRLDHEAAEAQFSAYVDGELKGADKAALEALARATGGTVEPSSLGDARKDVPSSTPLAAWLLLAAVLLIPLDANLRRPLRA